MRILSICLLLFFSIINAGGVDLEKSSGVVHVLTSLPAGKWCNNGVAGCYNAGDLWYVREVANNCKTDNVDSLLGFCRMHFLFALGCGEEFLAILNLNKKNIKSRCIARLYIENRNRLASLVPSATEQDLDDYAFISPFFFYWNFEYEKELTAQSIGGIFSNQLSVEEALVLLSACPSSPWYKFFSKPHLANYAACIAAALNVLLKRSGITLPMPNYHDNYFFNAKLEIARTYLDNIEERRGLTFTKKTKED